MAGGSLLTLLDDIASILDDVAVMTKRAASKTAGVLGDDLALNAQQVSGVVSNRELPVVWAVAKGSFVNKLILVPAALALNHFAKWAVMPLLIDRLVMIHVHSPASLPVTLVCESLIAMETRHYDDHAYVAALPGLILTCSP